VGDVIASENESEDLMMVDVKKGFALLGGAAVLVLGVTCLGGATSWATAPVGTAPAAPPSTSTTTSAQPIPTEETIEELPHDLGGGAGGGMG